MVYYCATGYANINVINGKGKGGYLEEINYIDHKDIEYYGSSDVFLDFTTGDFYNFKKDQDMWLPVGNVGLHYSKAAEKDNQQASKALSSQKVITSKITERKMVIDKYYLHHWVLKSVPTPFVASNESLWNAHDVELSSTSALEVNYERLVDSSKSHEVIAHKNTIAMQFHIDKKYHETIVILDNFIDHNILLIQEKGKIHMMIEEAENLVRSMMYTRGPNSGRTKAQAPSFSRSKAGKDNMSVTTKTNSIKKEGIRPTTARSGYTRLSVRNLSTRASSRAVHPRLYTAHSKGRLNSRQVRLFSPELNAQGHNTERTGIKTAPGQSRKGRKHSCMNTQIITLEDQDKLSKGKFNFERVLIFLIFTSYFSCTNL